MKNLLYFSSLLFLGCSSNKLVLTECQRLNCTTLFKQKMEVGVVYKINLCEEYFEYSFDGKKYTLKKIK